MTINIKNYWYKRFWFSLALIYSSEIYKRVDYENAREPTWCNSLNGSASAVPLFFDSPIKQVNIVVNSYYK